jgi:hypothetical protein
VDGRVRVARRLGLLLGVDGGAAAVRVQRGVVAKPLLRLAAGVSVEL